MKKLRTVPGIAALALGASLIAQLPSPAARAGTLRGNVKMPDGARSTRLFQGYWRLENGIVPVQNSGGAKAETVVVLENLKGKAPAARTVTVEIGGLDARPRLVIVGPGSVVEIKNTGKMRHELSTPETPQIMHLETLPPGATRRQKFDALGGFVIRDSEYPHMMVSVIVVDSPYYATLDEKGSFSIASVPDGKATLKVWTRGRWAAEQEVDTASVGKEELQVRVSAGKESQESKEGEKGE
jgi:plastocyanin